MIMTVVHWLWVLVMLSVVPSLASGVVMLCALWLWLSEISTYARKNKTTLIISTASVSGWRYSNFKIWFWHPDLVIVRGCAEVGYLPILRDSMRVNDYHRLLQLTWSIDNQRLIFIH